MPDLHMFYNDCDWVIAANEADAWNAYIAFCGGKREDYNDIEWERLDPTTPLSIYCDANGKVTEPIGDAKPTEKTVAEWINLNGRGWFASTEW